MRISRNQPCPCGSGEKYKGCCEGSLTEAQEEHFALLTTERRLKDALMLWIKRCETEEFNRLVSEFSGEDGAQIGEEELPAFFDWLFGEATKEGRRYLAIMLEELPELGEEEREVAEEWLTGTQGGVFEVVSSDADAWKVRIRDIFNSREYEVMDRRLAEKMRRGSLFFGRVQSIFGEESLSGAGRIYDRLYLDQLRAFVEEQVANEKKRDPAATYESLMRSCTGPIYHFRPEPPRILAPDGEEATSCVLTYAFAKKNRARIRRWLRQEPTLIPGGKNDEREEYACIAKRSRRKREKETGRVLVASSYQIDAKTGERIETEGSFTLYRERLELFAMSEATLERHAQLIEKGLPGLLRRGETKIRNPDDERPGEADDDISISPRLLVSSFRFFRDYCKEWCSERIPALDNRTPRQALKTEEGRSRLNELIKGGLGADTNQQSETGFALQHETIIRSELEYWDGYTPDPASDELNRAAEELEQAWTAFTERHPEPRSEEEERSQEEAFRRWYNEERPHSDTGQTPRQMGKRLLAKNLLECRLLKERKIVRHIRDEEMEEYGDILGPIEERVAQEYLKKRILTDKDVRRAYALLSKDPLRDEDDWLIRLCQAAAARGLAWHPITKRELGFLFAKLAESVENRDWLGDPQAYLKWVSSWLGLVSDEEMHELEQEYRRVGKMKGMPDRNIRDLIGTLHDDDQEHFI